MRRRPALHPANRRPGRHQPPDRPALLEAPGAHRPCHPGPALRRDGAPRTPLLLAPVRGPLTDRRPTGAPLRRLRRRSGNGPPSPRASPRPAPPPR
ncbi:hypothetical protein OG723_28360 [Streptomyces sp. NBC_01278]